MQQNVTNRIRCHLCGAAGPPNLPDAAGIDEAADLGWIPGFWRDDRTFVSAEVCPACVRDCLTIEQDDEPMLKSLSAARLLAAHDLIREVRDLCLAHLTAESKVHEILSLVVDFDVL